MVIVRFSRVGLAACPMCHPQVIRSRQLMRHNGGNMLKYQDHREGLRTLPLKSMECAIYGPRGLRGKEVPALAGGPCTGLQSCPPAFLALASVTVDEWQRLVASCEVAWHAQMACCYALHHCRRHLTLWPLIV